MVSHPGPHRHVFTVSWRESWIKRRQESDSHPNPVACVPPSSNSVMSVRSWTWSRAPTGWRGVPAPLLGPLNRLGSESADLGAYKFDDLAIAETGSSAYSGSEGGSAEPVTQVIHKGIDSLSVGSFEG